MMAPGFKVLALRGARAKHLGCGLRPSFVSPRVKQLGPISLTCCVTFRPKTANIDYGFEPAHPDRAITVPRVTNRGWHGTCNYPSARSRLVRSGQGRSPRTTSRTR